MEVKLFKRYQENKIIHTIVEKTMTVAKRISEKEEGRHRY
jgi:hypothetical protein